MHAIMSVKNEMAQYQNPEQIPYHSFFCETGELRFMLYVTLSRSIRRCLYVRNSEYTIVRSCPLCNCTVSNVVNVVYVT